jgi:hypothetical protein
LNTHDPYAKDKSTTRTIRIDEGYDDIIKYEAEKNGVSVNTLMEQLVRKYVLSYRFFENMSAISISQPTMLGLLQLMEEEELIEAAKELGAERPIELMVKRGLSITYDTAIWYISNLGENSGWFRSTLHVLQDKDMIHLSHPFGKKWSHFLKAYYISFFSEHVKVTPMAEVFTGSVSFTFPKRRK